MEEAANQEQHLVKHVSETLIVRKDESDLNGSENWMHWEK